MYHTPHAQVWVIGKWRTPHRHAATHSRQLAGCSHATDLQYWNSLVLTLNLLMLPGTLLVTSTVRVVGAAPAADTVAADRAVVHRYDDTQSCDHLGARDVEAQGQSGEVNPQQLRKRGHITWVKGDGGRCGTGALTSTGL